MNSYASILLALGGGVLSALITVAYIRWSERLSTPPLLATSLLEPCIFLYRGDRLLDATPPARIILDGCSGDSLPALKSWLAQRFDNLGRLEEVARTGNSVTLDGQSGTGTPRMRLLAEETPDGALRLTLVRPEGEAAGIVVDSLSQQAMEEELSLLRGIVNSAPMLILRRDAHDALIWANATYLATATAIDAANLSWPLPDILALDETAADAKGVHRAHILSGTELSWFDCHNRRDDSGTTTFALPADAQVRAEQNLREFLQTLTKTFADLPTGLAIFDRERQLQLFNPALIDLTGLSAGFLAGRPSLYSVLDQLRELRMVPEPRDYRSWRKQISTLETAASARHHVETWTLPGGRTYRVTGTPHPGGAVAFLFEDITSEITLTRRFRAELMLGSQVLDGLGEALVVFDALGQVAISNATYAELWGSPPKDLAKALRCWKGDWNEAPGLAELEHALGADDMGGGGRGVIFGPDGKGVLGWSVTALPGGKRMVRFAPPAGQDAKAGKPSNSTTELADQINSATG